MGAVLREIRLGWPQFDTKTVATWQKVPARELTFSSAARQVSTIGAKVRAI
jgi:hypothetical protein